MPFAVALVLLAASVVLAGALVVLHVAPTGLSPLADPVSGYALTRFRSGYATAATAAAVAGAAGALLMGAVPSGGIAAVLLWVFAAARVLIPFFPMDAPAAGRSRTGRLHDLLAIAAFATVTAAAFLAAAPLRDAGHDVIATITTIAAVVMAVGSAGVILSRPVPALRAVFGLTERIIYVGFIGWFLALAVAFLAGRV